MGIITLRDFDEFHRAIKEHQVALVEYWSPLRASMIAISASEPFVKLSKKYGDQMAFLHLAMPRRPGAAALPLPTVPTYRLYVEGIMQGEVVGHETSQPADAALEDLCRLAIATV
ncbi:hypothetical protein V8E36_000891 [Tilletia maclaganii]